MAWTVIWSEAAEADLDDIWLNIAQHDLVAADRQTERIGAAIYNLCEFPLLGRNRDEVEAGLRALVKDQYLLLYRVIDEAQQVRVQRILHGKRDFAAIFAEDNP